MKSHDSYSDVKSPKILLVGDVSRAFLDPGLINQDAGLKSHCEVCVNIHDAIDAASKHDFTAIAVVMSGLSARLSSSLKSLRANCNAKVILLAQMYEEPIARQLVGAAHNGTIVADDYFICPIQPKSFCETLLNNSAGTAVETPVSIPAASKVSVPEATTERRIRELEKLATEDDLTHLKNRRYIWEFSRQIIEHAGKENGQVTLLVFDIDDFKHYNDIYGHYAGDEILKQAAVLMKRCCRSHDVVGRIGGDEFAVIFWDDPQVKHKKDPAKGVERRSTTADHPKEAIIIAKRLVKELENTELPAPGGLGPEGKGVLTISGGLASFPRDGKTIEELFRQADKALLEAKKSGKNRIYLVGKPQSNITDID
jgi:PleD family two-component response regulator